MLLEVQGFQFGDRTTEDAWGGFVTAFRVNKDRTTSLAISCNTDKQDPEAVADSLGKLWM